MNSALRMVRNVFLSTLFLSVALSILVSSVTNSPIVQGDLYGEGKNSPLTGELDIADTSAIFEGNEIALTQNLFNEPDVELAVLGSTVVSTDEKWVEVDLSEQKLRAWEGNNLFLETPISSGLPHTPTPTGEFRIWIKLRATKMEGGSGRYYYYLPNVPYVMFFSNDKVPAYKGYGLHGTYWHNSFGTPRSHGCVNLPTPVAEKLYYWTTPTLPKGKSVVRASTENIGTRIIIHQ